MIAKTKANRSFRGTTKYVIEKAQASLIGGNMIGNSTSQLVKQFLISRNLNPQVKEPCYHLMLSLPHNETLTDEQFAEVGERHFATVVILSQLTGDKAKLTNPDKRIKEAELNELVDKFLEDKIHQYSFFIARHHDREHNHIHIVASRINEVTTKVIKTWKQYPQSEFSARLLEKRFGLEQIPCSWESKNKALTRNQLERLAKDGLPGAEIIRRAIDAAVQDQPTMPVLVERLAERGILAEVSYQSNGKVRGIKFKINVGEVDEQGNPKLLSITGGGLNRHKYSFPKLISELGVSYLPERDDEFLRATAGSARKLLTAEPIKFVPIDSNPVKDSPHAELELNKRLERQKEKIRSIIDQATVNRLTFTELIHSLPSRGINPRVQVTRTGLIQGISFESEGEKFSGTSLGANYSLKGLQRAKGIDWDLERDVEVLAAIAYSNSQKKSAIHNQPTERIMELLLDNPNNLAINQSEVGTEEKKSQLIEKEVEKLASQREEEVDNASRLFDEPEGGGNFIQSPSEVNNPASRSESIPNLEEAYAVYEAAQYILDCLGQQGDNYRYVQGNNYRISSRGARLSISHSGRSEAIYLANDYRETGGNLEINQLKMTAEEQEIILAYAQSLWEQNQERSRQVQRGGFEIGD